MFILEWVQFAKYNSLVNPYTGTSDSQNQRLAEALEFTPDELALNKAGLLSERQDKLVEQAIRWRRTSGRWSVFVLFLSLGVLWLVGFTLIQEEFDSQKLQSQLPIIYGSWLLIGGVVLAVFAFFFWLDRSRLAELQSRKISIIAGPASLAIRELKGARLYGMLAYYLKIGQVQFQLAGESQYKAFEQGRSYRIIYIKNPPTQTILSVEWLEN